MTRRGWFLGLLLLGITGLFGCGFLVSTISSVTGLPSSITIPASVVLSATGGPEGALLTWTFGTDCGGTFSSTTTPNDGPGNPLTIGPTYETTVQVTYDSTGATAGSCTFTVKLSEINGNTATFSATVTINSINRTLTITGAGDGMGTVVGSVSATGSSVVGMILIHSISCSINGGTAAGTCAQIFTNGTSVLLTALAAGGSFFLEWSGDCSGTSLTSVVTMDADKTCIATFILLH